jgi:hypothetical protein
VIRVYDEAGNVIETRVAPAWSGKAFYDVDHAPRNQTNRKSHTSSVAAVWDIHPVMRLSTAR